MQNEGQSQQQQMEQEKEQLKAEAERAWQQVGRVEREAAQTSLKAAQDMETLTHSHTISQVMFCTVNIMRNQFDAFCATAAQASLKIAWNMKAALLGKCSLTLSKFSVYPHGMGVKLQQVGSPSII